MDNSTKIYVTTKKAAEDLGVSVTTIQQWCEAGLLDAYKTSGGHRRIARDSVRNMSANTIIRHKHTMRTTGAKAQPSSLKVLVVEDDTTLREIYKHRLSNWNMSVDLVCAQNGIEALMLIGTTSPNLMITDLRMPGMDGFKVLETLRAVPTSQEMTIVVVR